MNYIIKAVSFFLVLFIAGNVQSSSKCDIPDRYSSLCQFKLQEIPSFVVDTKGLVASHPTIDHYLRADENKRFPMQFVLNLALQGNSDAMVILAHSYKEADWKEYWFNKAAEKLNKSGLFWLAKIQREGLSAEDKKLVSRKMWADLFQSKIHLYEDESTQYHLKENLAFQLSEGDRESNIERYSDYLANSDIEIYKAVPSTQELIQQGNPYALDWMAKNSAATDFYDFVKNGHESPLLLKRLAVCHFVDDFRINIDKYHWGRFLSKSADISDYNICSTKYTVDHDKAFSYVEKLSRYEVELYNKDIRNTGYSLRYDYQHAKDLNDIGMLLFLHGYYKEAFKIYNKALHYAEGQMARDIYIKALLLVDPIANISSISNIKNFTNLIESPIVNDWGDSDLPYFDEKNYYEKRGGRLSLYYRKVYSYDPYLKELGVDEIFKSAKIKLPEKISTIKLEMNKESFFDFVVKEYYSDSNCNLKRLNDDLICVNFSSDDRNKAIEQVFGSLGSLSELEEQSAKFMIVNFRAPSLDSNYFFEKNLLNYYRNVAYPNWDLDSSDREQGLTYKKGKFPHERYSFENIVYVKNSDFEKSLSYGSIYALEMLGYLNRDDASIKYSKSFYYKLPVDENILTGEYRDLSYRKKSDLIIIHGLEGIYN